MIKHEFDLDYLLLSLEEDPNEQDSQQYFKDRFELLVSKSLETSPTMRPLNNSNRHAFGKLKLKINSLENLACSNTFFIRVTSDPFVVTSKKIIGLDAERLMALKNQKLKDAKNAKDGDVKLKQGAFDFKIQQMFFIPITSRFGQVKIEVVSSTVKGLFKGNTVETVLLSFSIPVPSLGKEPFNSKTPFSLKFFVDPKRVGQVMEDALRKEWDGSSGSRLKIEIEDISNQLVMATPNPNIEIVEDRRKKDDPGRKDLTLTVARASTISSFFNDIDAVERTLFFHKYPRLSKTY